MSTGIAPAALKPSVPSASGGNTATAAGAPGFSELLDKSAGNRARQPASPSSEAPPPEDRADRHHDAPSGNPSRDAASAPPPSPAEAGSTASAKQPAKGDLSATASEDGKAAADTEEQAGDPESRKHQAVAIDVSAILFGLSAPTIAGIHQSGGKPSGASSGGQPSGASGTIAGRDKETQVAGIMQSASATGNASANAAASTARSQSPVHLQGVTVTMAASPADHGGASAAALTGDAAHPFGSERTAPNPVAGKTSADGAGSTAQLQSSTRLQGVTVTAASGTPSVAASAIIGNPQPAEAESGAAGDASSRSTGAGTNAAAASDTANQAPPAMPAGPSGRNAGAGTDTGSHRRGDDNGQGKPSSAISSSAGSTQATISAAFGSAGGSSTPFLGQTASSFVSGLGTPQSWAAYTSQFAYMANAPAMAAPVRSLSIALQPAELGSVTANLHLSGQQLRIDVEVRTEEAHQRLSSDADEIVKSLRSLGFDVSHVTIRHGGNTPLAAGGANQAAGQGNNAPFQGSGASGGGSGGSATQSNSGQKDADRDSRSPAPQPVGDSRSRGVYI